MTCEQLTVGIVGLGLIGGSMARTYAAAEHRCLRQKPMPKRFKEHLIHHRTALIENNASTLTALLREGRIAKENADKDGDDSK